MKNEDARILLVDDDEEYCRLMAGQLNHWGYQSRYITDPREALNTFLVFRPHVVLLDVRLPHKDGLELLKEMLAKSPKTAVVMLSAHVDEPIAKKAIKLGASDYITKPSESDELKRVITWLITDIEQGP